MDAQAHTEIVRDLRNATAKGGLFLERFTGLPNVYGTYDPQTGKSWQVKEPVTDQVILDHLRGRRPYGVYLLVGDRTRAAVADFDYDVPGFAIQFVNRADHYGVASYIERSKSKGYHVWVFFTTPGVQAWKIRRVFQHVLNEIECPNVEVFPKQDRLPEESAHYGNFINVPLFGALVPKGKTVFVDPAHDLAPYSNQWEFLECVQLVPESSLDEIIEINDLGQEGNGRAAEIADGILGVFQATYALPACAQTMLRNGVTQNQRVACFRLAVHLRRVGLPYELVVATLAEWARKNQPTQGKQILSETEIKAQTASAFLKEYRGNGCEEPAVSAHCDPECPIRMRNTPETPCARLPQDR